MAQLKINSEFCKSCGLCVPVCPKEVLEIGKNINSKGYRYIKKVEEKECIGCKSCTTVCPEGAIELNK